MSLYPRGFGSDRATEAIESLYFSNNPKFLYVSAIKNFNSSVSLSRETIRKHIYNFEKDSYNKFIFHSDEEIFDLYFNTDASVREIRLRACRSMQEIIKILKKFEKPSFKKLRMEPPNFGFNVGGGVLNTFFNSKEYLEWDSCLKELYDGRCAICGSGSRTYTTTIYDFLRYPELRLEKENGILICDGCGTRLKCLKSNHKWLLKTIIFLNRYKIGDEFVRPKLF